VRRTEPGLSISEDRFVRCYALVVQHPAQLA
jgi:hypothetical protein